MVLSAGEAHQYSVVKVLLSVTIMCRWKFDPDSLRSPIRSASCGVYDIRDAGRGGAANPKLETTSKSQCPIPKGDGLDADASPGVGRVRKGETVPERFEAKPGDMKLVVFGGPNPFSIFPLGRERVGWVAMMAKAWRSSGRSSRLLKQQVGETMPERSEAKPGDMKLVVFGSEIPFFNSPSDSLRSHGVETLGKGETPGALAFRTALEAVLS